MLDKMSLPIVWSQNSLKLLDQRLLPAQEKYLEITNIEDCMLAIRNMVVRGAPCIGFTAIFGLALWVKKNSKFDLNLLRGACDFLISARPTAVNLKYEVETAFTKIQKMVSEDLPSIQIFQEIVNYGIEKLHESHEKNLAMAKIALNKLSCLYGQTRLNLMTHCNTGYLACGSLGTALGVISYAHSLGRVEHVFADETRPYLQGSRLTAFELMKENIPHSIVVEGAASYLMYTKKIHAIFVGADRIALNGDTANKIGTSTLAIIASFYKVPFYVVAPTSSFDLSIPSGDSIEIEMRDGDEIKKFNNFLITPSSSNALNPSFDVTTSNLITGIICEKGYIDPQIPGELERVVKG